MQYYALLKSRIALLTAPLIVLGGIACERPSTPPSKIGGTLLNPPLEFPINGIDPAIVTHIVDDMLAQQVFDGLLQYQPVTFELAAGLAEKWSTPDNGCTWDFHLRSDAYFQDDACFADGVGRAVTANDVKYSLERIISWPENDATWRTFEEISGAESYRKGRSATISGITVLDDSTLRLTLQRPSPLFLHRLASVRGYVVPREAIEKYGERFRVHPVGSGPFRLAKLEPEVEMIFVRNDRYWQKDSAGGQLPYVSKIKVAPSSQTNGMMAMPTLDGEIISCGPAAGEKWLEVINTYNQEQPETRHLRVVKSPIANTIFFAFRMDLNTPYTRNKFVRQALAYAFNTRAMITDTTQVLYAHGLIPPGMFWYHPKVRGYEYNMQKAAALLKEAGYANGEGLPPIKLNTVETYSEYYEKVRTDLRSLGIRMEVEILPTPEHFPAARAGAFEFFRFGWICDYPDALDLFQLFYSSSPNNAGLYSNSEYDRLFDAASRETDRDRLFALYEKMEAILQDECPAIWMLHEMQSGAIPAWIHNLEWSINPVRMRFLKYVWMDAAKSE